MLRLGKILNICTVIALLIFSATTVQADVLFQQSPDNLWAGISDIPDQQLADDFSISSGGSIAEVKWTGTIDALYVTPPPNDMVIRFYSDNNGIPGNTPLATYPIGSAAVITDTGMMDPYGVEIYTYDYVLSSSFNAAAGTTYWISILSGSPWNWGWYTSDQTNWYAYRWGETGTWYNGVGGNLAFELDGTTSSVPEPTTMLLLGLGLIGLTGVRRKFKQ